MKTHHYERIGTVSIDTITEAQAAAVSEGMGNRQPKIELFGLSVKLFSKGTRLKTFFHHGHICSSCGLAATHYAVERSVTAPSEYPYHLNLWGIDSAGQEILFTHDHTLARSAGGRDDISNTTTMCSPCNNAKSLIEQRG